MRGDTTHEASYDKPKLWAKQCIHFYRGPHHPTLTLLNASMTLEDPPSLLHSSTPPSGQVGTSGHGRREAHQDLSVFQCFHTAVMKVQNGISNTITHLQATCGGQKLSQFQIQDAFHEFIQHLTVALCEAWKSHSSLDLIDFWTLKLGDNQKWLAISYDFVREPLAP